MAVLAVNKYDLRSGMTEAYVEWATANIQVQLSVPGIVEVRSYRPIAGSSQIAVTYEFADLAAYASWRAHSENERIFTEAHEYCENISVELWEPSPVSAAPYRPE